MLRMKESVSVLLILVGMQGMGAGGCRTKQGNSGTVNVNTTARPTPTQGRVEEPVKGELTVLAEGAYGKITDTFIVVARNAQTYAALREFAMNSLPDLSADYFRTNIVVAAFLGQRNTGGYSVQITRVADNRLRVSSASPPKDAMTTQALTAPFKIVSVAVDENRSFAVELDALWTNEMRPYRVTSGDFTTGGGFAGRFEKLQLVGDIRIGRLGPLATLVFDLKSTGGKKERLLQNVATGLVAAGGELSNAVVDAGSLVDFPRSPLGLKGSLGANGDKLSLTFESLPSNVNDGYGGQGKLEANATAPPPKKKPANIDGPM